VVWQSNSRSLWKWGAISSAGWTLTLGRNDEWRLKGARWTRSTTRRHTILWVITRRHTILWSTARRHAILSHWHIRCVPILYSKARAKLLPPRSEICHATNAAVTRQNLNDSNKQEGGRMREAYVMSLRAREAPEEACLTWLTRNCKQQLQLAITLGGPIARTGIAYRHTRQVPMQSRPVCMDSLLHQTTTLRSVAGRCLKQNSIVNLFWKSRSHYVTAISLQTHAE